MAVQARSVRSIGGGVTIRDYRGTGLLRPSPAGPGGSVVHIRPLVFVEHIPVIPNRRGIEDGLQLARVLNDQGLAVHTGDDSEGNVFRFTNLDELCWQAKGANALSCGTEHMHLTIGEPWSERQMRASAYMAVVALERQGIPLENGGLIAGPGIVKVKQRGHVGHAYVARAAGFNDRTDPGAGFHRQHMYELARFFQRHRHF